MYRKDAINVFVWLCMVTLLLALSSKSQVIGKNGHVVDCKKYVFAPVCRGVGAKRMFPPLRTMSQRINDELAEKILAGYQYGSRRL